MPAKVLHNSEELYMKVGMRKKKEDAFSFAH
jgi:hypothetical protein